MSCSNDAKKTSGQFLRVTGVPSDSVRAVHKRVSEMSDEELWQAFLAETNNFHIDPNETDRYSHEDLELALKWFGNDGEGDRLLRMGHRLRFSTLIHLARQKEEITLANAEIDNIQARVANPSPDDLEVLSLLTEDGVSLAWIHIKAGGFDDLKLTEIDERILALPALVNNQHGQHKIAHKWEKAYELLPNMPLDKQEEILCLPGKNGFTVAHMLLHKEARSSGNYTAPVSLNNDRVMTAANDWGRTVAHLAAAMGKPVPEKYYGLKDADGATVAHDVAGWSPEKLSKEQLLWADIDGNTPAHAAVSSGYVDCLLDPEILTAKNNRGESVYETAMSTFARWEAWAKKEEDLKWIGGLRERLTTFWREHVPENNPSV